METKMTYTVQAFDLCKCTWRLFEVVSTDADMAILEVATLPDVRLDLELGVSVVSVTTNPS
jgi:hypothetical protein